MKVKAKINKKNFLITFFFIAIILSIYIYQYKKDLSYLILNNVKKSVTKEISKSKNTDNDIFLTQEVIETINAERLQNSSTPTIQNTSRWWEYPKTVLETPKNGNDLLVLVNKKYKLPSSYTPSDLVRASNSGIRRGDSYYLRNILINDLKRLVNDISSQGIDLSIVSGYRSYETQKNTYQYWINYNNGNISEADKISARPGHSQHQLGTTIDFSTNEINDTIGTHFAGTKAQKWLAENAYKYGFALSYPLGAEEITGYSSESWHYRYIGINNALDWEKSGLVLDKWLETK